MATLPTFTPSAYLQFATPLITVSGTTFLGMPSYDAVAAPIAVALPTGSDPAMVLIQNLGTEPAAVLIETAAATTTGTATAGASSITVADATGIVLGQVVVAVGIPDGTIVTSIAGTTVGISQPITAPLSSTAVNFITAPTPSTGIVSQPGTALALAYTADAYIAALCINSGSRSILNVAVGV